MQVAHFSHVWNKPGMTPAERSGPLQLLPEMATLTCGTLPFADDVFEHSFPIMPGIVAATNKYGVRPAIAIFVTGNLRTSRWL